MRLFEADVVDGFLDGQFIEADERETEEKADAVVEKQERFAKRTLDAFGWAFYRGGIGNAPVRGHGLAGPDGTDFARGVVANGENKIEFGRAGLRKFIPILAAQTGDRQASEFELPERERPFLLRIASAMMERAELPVQRNSTRYCGCVEGISFSLAQECSRWEHNRTRSSRLFA